MGADAPMTKMFDSMPRDELEGYAKDFGIASTASMSDTELRKRLKDVKGNTGTAPESKSPVEHRGDPGRGPNH
jgi:hypothetical protein